MAKVGVVGSVGADTALPGEVANIVIEHYDYKPEQHESSIMEAVTALAESGRFMGVTCAATPHLTSVGSSGKILCSFQGAKVQATLCGPSPSIFRLINSNLSLKEHRAFSMSTLTARTSMLEQSPLGGPAQSSGTGGEVLGT